MLQMDNVPIHISKMCNQFMIGIGMNVLNWPPNGLDINTIDNFCAEVKIKVQ